MRKKADSYRELDIMTCSKLELLIKLYQGANDFMAAAKKAIEDNSPSEKSFFIAKARAIIHELQNTLDPQASMDIARNLYILYDFVLDRLETANSKSSTQALDEAMKVMSTLQSGWEELSQKLGPQVNKKISSHVWSIRA